jgi:serine phosphatase RsbU (regulator of sigma subunit)
VSQAFYATSLLDMHGFMLEAVAYENVDPLDRRALPLLPCVRMPWMQSAADRRAAWVGALVLVVIALVYPSVAAGLGRPLSFFVLPGLLTAVLGGWRPTLIVGLSSLAVAIAEGVAGPLPTEALVARLTIIGLGVAMGAVGAAVRDAQASRLAELDEAMELREAFQRALAPVPQPPPGLIAVASYRPAEEWLTTGGDFLEAVTLHDGRLAVLLGDVCGHGPREAAFGAALRAGWKSIVLSHRPDPEQWVQELDTAFFRDGRFDSYATLCTGYLDPRADGARLVNAGHPPPVLLPPDQDAQLLSLRVCRPLGIDIPAMPVATDIQWCGDPMLFYSDGLIENPMKHGAPDRWGLEGLTGWLDQHRTTRDPDALLRELDSAAASGRDLRDDVAMLLVARASS